MTTIFAVSSPAVSINPTFDECLLQGSLVTTYNMESVALVLTRRVGKSVTCCFKARYKYVLKGGDGYVANTEIRLQELSTTGRKYGYSITPQI